MKPWIIIALTILLCATLGTWAAFGSEKVSFLTERHAPTPPLEIWVTSAPELWVTFFPEASTAERDIILRSVNGTLVNKLPELEKDTWTVAVMMDEGQAIERLKRNRLVKQVSPVHSAHLQ